MKSVEKTSDSRRQVNRAPRETRLWTSRPAKIRSDVREIERAGWISDEEGRIGGANRERKSHECRTDSNLVERRQPNKLSGTCRHDGSRGLTTVRALQLVDGKQQIKWNLAGTDVCRWCRMLISRRPSRGLCRGWTELDDGL